MYWVAKVFQAAGLGVMAWGFLANFPRLLPYNVLLVAALLFGTGWLIQTYMLRN